MGITVSDRARNYVRRRAQDHMVATITLYRFVEVEFDVDTGLVSTPTRTAYYTGKCRIAPLNTGGEIVVGDADLAIADTRISIPFGSPDPKIDDVGVVGVNPADPTVNGRAFAIISFTGGGLIGGTISMNCKSLSDSAAWQHE